MKSTTEIGSKGESLARDFLIEKGYKILDQNWTCNKSEIDLIVKLEQTVCFIEVKTRVHSFSVNPVLAVSPSQQKRIINSANVYIEQFSIDEEIRFDVIGVVHDKGIFKIDQHLEGAFYPTID